MTTTVNFGHTAADYRRHRRGFPPAFFERMGTLGLVAPGTQVLDLGTGTGTLARGFAAMGAKVTGMDIAQPLLAEARALSLEENVSVEYRVGRAEATGLEGQSFDVVTAGQCWHWFEASDAAREVFRLLRPGGRVIIAHFDWIPLPGNVVTLTENLIRQANPQWNMYGGTGLYPRWLTDLGAAGFADLRTESFDLGIPYTHQDWRGRIRASAGVSASLPPEVVVAFDQRHGVLLAEHFPGEELVIPHRVWWVSGTRP